MSNYLVLIGAIALGAILRFWNLDLKPLWLDEVITALFSLGRSFHDVPLDVVFPLARLEQIFTFKPGVSCSQIAHTVATQSTHPPLFFCLMHTWLGTPLVGVMSHGWVWSLRSLPALFGSAAIAAIYCLNARAFSPAAGLSAAMVMAVSPFAVYLSQEARHYTLPMLLIALALLGLIQIQQDLLLRRHLRFRVWFGWMVVNSIGFYVQYFFILALLAQLATLLGLMYRQRRLLPRHSWVAVGLAIAGIGLSYLPWLPTMLGHSNRPETSWIPRPSNIAPLYQTIINWLLMVIALPVENQHLWIAVLSGLLMVLFGMWVAWQAFGGLRQLWYTQAHLATLTLMSFTLWVLLEFLAIVYLLGKDITVVPRYNFVYYPSICALLGASLLIGRNTTEPQELPQLPQLPQLSSPLPLFLVVGVISSVFVISNWVLQKPFYPQQVAHNLNQEPSVPLMVVVGYSDYQDVALGLSFALALEKVRNDTDFAFFKSSSGYEPVWQKLSQLPQPAFSQLNLWVIGPGLRQRDYPSQLALSSQNSCTLDPTKYYRIGVPYQLYRCAKHLTSLKPS